MILHLVLAGLIPVTVAAAFGLAVAWLLRRSSSVVRRQVAISFLIIAAAFAFLPLAPRPVLARLPSPSLPAVMRPVRDFSQAPMAAQPASVPDAAILRPIQFSVALLAEWITALLTALLLGRWVLGWFGAFLMLRRSRPFPTDLTRLPVRLTPGLDVPASLGGPRSVILLPEDCANLDSLELQPILLHEETHIRNRDHLWNSVADLLCALHWFNPCVWLLRRLLRFESERIADDQVLLAGHSRPGYASLLLSFQRKAQRSRPSPLQAIVTRNATAARFKSILEPSTRRSLVKPRTSLLLAAAAVVVAVPLALGFLVPGAFTSASTVSRLISGSEQRRVELVQVGRKIGGAVEFWDGNGNPVPKPEQIRFPWRPDDIGPSGFVNRYLHIVYRVRAEAGDTDPETSVGSPSNRIEVLRPGTEGGYASSDFLFTKDGWHYFVDHMSLGPVDKKILANVVTAPDLAGVKDLGHRPFKPTYIGICFGADRWTDDEPISRCSWVKSISIEPATQLPKGFGLERRAKVWSKLTYVSEHEPTDDMREYDAYLKGGSRVPDNLVMGSFGHVDPKNYDRNINVYYIGAPMDKIDHLSQRTRPNFQGDLEVPLSPNSDFNREPSGITP